MEVNTLSGNGSYRSTTTKETLRSKAPLVVSCVPPFIQARYSFYRGFVLPRVLYYPLLGPTLKLRLWPTPLGPPTDLMPGHLSPACGLTTLNATHLRDGQSRRSSSLRELGISIVRAARASTPDLLRAWCRSLAGRQPLGLGEDVGRVGGSAQRAQQLGGLQEHDTN